MPDIVASKLGEFSGALGAAAQIVHVVPGDTGRAGIAPAVVAQGRVVGESVAITRPKDYNLTNDYYFWCRSFSPDVPPVGGYLQLVLSFL